MFPKELINIFSTSFYWFLSPAIASNYTTPTGRPWRVIFFLPSIKTSLARGKLNLPILNSSNFLIYLIYIKQEYFFLMLLLLIGKIKLKSIKFSNGTCYDLCLMIVFFSFYWFWFYLFIYGCWFESYYLVHIKSCILSYLVLLLKI